MKTLCRLLSEDAVVDVDTVCVLVAQRGRMSYSVSVVQYLFLFLYECLPFLLTLAQTNAAIVMKKV